MPHLILEYTENLSRRTPDASLLLALHRMLESEAGIHIGNCKSRCVPLASWLVGDGTAESAFAHLSIRFLEGRGDAVLQRVGTAALEILRAWFQPPPGDESVQLTVEVGEIRRAAYFKHPPGTLTPPPFRNA